MQLKLPIKHAGGGHWIFRCQGIEKAHPEVRQVVLRAIPYGIAPLHGICKRATAVKS